MIGKIWRKETQETISSASLTFGSAADVAVTVDVIFPPAGASIGTAIMMEMSSYCVLPKVVIVGLMITSLSMLIAFIVKVSV